MKITVLFFASLKNLAKTNRLELDVKTGITVAAFLDELILRLPELAGGLSNVVVSVNQNFAFPEDEVPANAEVALFPPVSGGSEPFKTICKITNDILDLDELVENITFPTTGAICVFTGVVRGETARGEAHETFALEYEAYVPMAEAKMRQVADEIRDRWTSIEGIVIVQRIGYLKPGTPTVLIACSAGHRDTGVFDAARYGIDRLKEIVPVWKKEIGPGGELWIEGDYSPKKSDQ